MFGRRIPRALPWAKELRAVGASLQAQRAVNPLAQPNGLGVAPKKSNGLKGCDCYTRKSKIQRRFELQCARDKKSRMEMDKDVGNDKFLTSAATG